MLTATVKEDTPQFLYEQKKAQSGDCKTSQCQNHQKRRITPYMKKKAESLMLQQ
jgi:hypothetical protein